MSDFPDNATLISIRRRTGADGLGRPIYAATETVSVRCNAGDPTGKQKFNLGATNADASFVAYLYDAELAAAGVRVPNKGDQVGVVIDGDMEPITGEIIQRRRQALDELSHFECFVQNT